MLCCVPTEGAKFIPGGLLMSWPCAMEDPPTPHPLPPASSGSFQILSQSQLTCRLLEPRAKARLPAFDTGEGAPCSVRPRALLTADQDVFLEEYAFQLVLAWASVFSVKMRFPVLKATLRSLPRHTFLPALTSVPCLPRILLEA